MRLTHSMHLHIASPIMMRLSTTHIGNTHTHKYFCSLCIATLFIAVDDVLKRARTRSMETTSATYSIRRETTRTLCEYIRSIYAIWFEDAQYGDDFGYYSTGHVLRAQPSKLGLAETPPAAELCSNRRPPEGDSRRGIRNKSPFSDLNVNKT